jgi:predicted amidohydrolase YtcJ
LSGINLVEELCADLIVTNCKAYTADPNDTVAEAVAVRDGRILKVGLASEVMRLKGRRTRVLNLDGRLVLPGFIDSHEHCIRKGLQADWVECGSPPMKTIRDIIEALRVKAEEKPAGEWVIGNWFDDSKLEEKRFPTRGELDEASSDHPIYLGRAGGHNSWPTAWR